MAGPQHLATAAFALAVLLAARAFSPAGAAPAACPTPREQEAQDGQSAAASCRGAADAPSLRGPARLLFGLRLDPNRADRASLEVLPGIGPARAEAIERERCQRPFARVAELDRVAGIGPRTVARLRPWLAVSTPPQARCPRVD
jgi:competence protein ComEA